MQNFVIRPSNETLISIDLECSVKKVLLEFPQNSYDNSGVKLSFLKKF